MLDAVDRDSWGDEPTEQEVLEIIAEVKAEMINHYKLKTVAGGNKSLLTPEKNDNSYEAILYEVARRQLLRVVELYVPLYIPTQFHHLFQSLLTDCIPETKVNCS